MSHGQHEKAVQLQITAGNIRGALDLCMEKGVNVTEEMAENMTLPKTKDERAAAERVELLLKLALCCEKRGGYQLAAKKYTQAGDKLKAMQALLKSGDTEKIVFFANVARQGKIYIRGKLPPVAGLAQRQWRDYEIDVHSTQRQKLESLSSFYESCYRCGTVAIVRCGIAGLREIGQEARSNMHVLAWHAPFRRLKLTSTGTTRKLCLLCARR